MLLQMANISGSQIPEIWETEEDKNSQLLT
jgi:hypothetical protein